MDNRKYLIDNVDIFLQLLKSPSGMADINIIFIKHADGTFSIINDDKEIIDISRYALAEKIAEAVKNDDWTLSEIEILQYIIDNV